MSYINLVYMTEGYKGELKRIRVREEVYEYLISTRARWEPIIAVEKVVLKANTVVQIDIRPIKLNPDELIIPCPVVWNCLGHVLGIGHKGAPQRVESARSFEYVDFLAVRDGTVVEGDLLGVLNVFPKATLIPLMRGGVAVRAPPPYRS